MKFFSNVYYREKKDYAVSDRLLEDPVFINFYIQENIKSKGIADMCSFFEVSPISYGFIKGSVINITEFNITYDALINFYKRCLSYSDVLYDYTVSPRVKSQFDVVLLQSKNSIGEYVLFLRSFPYFNYFMISKRQDYIDSSILDSSGNVINNDSINAIDIDEKVFGDWNFIVKYFFFESIMHYLANVNYILSGDTDLFKYHILIPESLVNKKVAMCQLRYEFGITEESDELFDIFNINRLCYKWYLKKFIIKELDSVFGNEIEESDDDDIKHYKELFTNFSDFVRNTENEMKPQIDDEFNIFFRRLFNDYINLMKFINTIKNRSDFELILSLLFSTHACKIIVLNTGKEPNFLLCRIKYFEEEKNVLFYVK